MGYVLNILQTVLSLFICIQSVIIGITCCMNIKKDITENNCKLAGNINPHFMKG